MHVQSVEGRLLLNEIAKLLMKDLTEIKSNVVGGVLPYYATRKRRSVLMGSVF